ncbi:MAG: hypothetical protein GF388_10620 [Candidatus Aegiribacteria sp.]|nr:hypothetical protein [Candidatus Aegiribacteria sp.]MBD3295471.1 hypothetical protein [Candidatus Fermentibacteria bacterium]
MILNLVGLLFAGLVSIGMSDLRQPDLSPDCRSVVFCFRGDIWEAPVQGGAMRSLVPGNSIETSPHYSPDGRFLAFTSDRTGGGDVYVMDSEGGSSSRLTYHGGNDRVVGWSPGSDSVYFASSRLGADSWVYSVSVEGGTPVPLAAVHMRDMCTFPGGLILERGFTRWWRKHYNGSAASRLWAGSGSGWELLDDSPLDSRWPMYSVSEEEVYFTREDSSGHNALWSMDIGGTPRQRTFLDEGDVTFPSMSSSGDMIVFEYMGELRLFDLSSSEVSRIPVTASVDYAFPVEYGETVGYSTDCYHMDSSGSRIAVVGQGDIFAGRIVDDDIEDLAEIYSGPWRARDPVWSPDGEKLAFTLDTTQWSSWP